MKKLKVKADGPLMLVVTFIAQGRSVLQIKGYEKDKPNTVYFDRKYGSVEKPVSGKIELKFPFPDKFEKLGLDVVNVLNTKSKVKIEKITHEALHARESGFKQQTKDFIKFASEFARKAGHIPLNTYQSADGNYTISFLDRIKDHKTGEIINTPARVNHVTGLIEVSKKDFQPMSVANRLYILMHEYCHFANGTTDEVECDMVAAKTLMELGYSSIEALYSVSKLFMYNKDLPVAQRLEQETRVQTVKNFINQFAIL